MIRYRMSAAIAVGTLCAGCAGNMTQSGVQSGIAVGSVGHSDTAPTFHVSGTVSPALELTLFVEYVAGRHAAECTRVDGESGRVVRTKWMRYPVQPHDGRYAIDILLDPLDTIGCAFVPRTVYGSTKDLRNGKATDAYLPWVAFPSGQDQGRTQLAEQTINCQDGATAFACSLPREQLGNGRLCTTERLLRCAAGCSAVFHVVFVDPPRADALWALPSGCPGPS